MSTMPRAADRGLAAGGGRAGQPLLTQLGDLLRMELSNWRWSWRSLLITATLSPLVSVLGLGVFARDSGPEALLYVLTGNVVISLMFGNLGNVESHFTFMRARGALDYMATLPIRREALILAVVLAFLLMPLPSLVVTIGVGSAILGVPVRPHPLLALVVPLSVASLASVGALIGVAVRTPEEGGSLALLFTLLLAALGPVVVPPDRLPAALVAVGRLSPATYAASALRQTLVGPVTGRIALDLGVLAVVTGVLLALVARRMDWRQA